MARITVATLAPPASFASIALGNGVHLHYARQGPPDGPVIIFLHGYSDSLFSFSRVMPLLPPELRVIALDLRGHGHSARPANGYRIGDFASDVLRMMDLLGVPEATIVGHSMGSFVAQAIAERAPGRVSRLDADCPPRASPTIHGMRELRRPRSIRFPILSTSGSCAPSNTARSPAGAGRVHGFGHRQQPPHAGRTSGRRNRGPDRISARRRARRPTLVIGGTAMPCSQWKSRRTLAAISAVHELRHDRRHRPHAHWEHPQTFVDELLDFVALTMPQWRSAPIPAVGAGRSRVPHGAGRRDNRPIFCITAAITRRKSRTVPGTFRFQIAERAC